ncbi:MAG: sugar ABC transporter ATP-binding protein, partial [Pseudomonadota bacterium]
MTPAAGPAASLETERPFLQVRNVKKHFGGVRALDGIEFALRAGEIHALVGENGAGKSTLIKILTGVYPYDSGMIEFAGEPYHPQNPNDAKSKGVQVVHQEFNLLDHLSVAENISIEAMPKTRLGLLDRAEMNRRAREAVNAIGLTDVDVRTPVSNLGIAHRQLIEIARALQSRSRLLILDEPTATLTERETSRLFDIVRAIRDDGVTVVFVSHHLEEVFALCERVTVFRNGTTVATENIGETTPESVVRHMVGRTVDTRDGADTTRAATGDVALRVRDLKVGKNPHADGVSFDVSYGEIFGIAGLVGSGRTEILRALFGIDPILGGIVERDGVEVRFAGPNDAIGAGLGFVTEDRKDQGLILQMSIAANMSLVNLHDISKYGLIDFSRERLQARDIGASLTLKYGATSDPASSLSGGNQQKVVLAKWLARNPRVLILDEPTRGVDVGAKFEIYSILRRLAADGVAILIVSSEMPELMTLADRIMVLANHSAQGVLTRDEFAEERILRLAYGQETPIA